MPERIDDYVSQQFEKRYGKDPLTSNTRPVTKTETPALKGLSVEQVIASELDLLSKSGNAATKQQVEKIMAKAEASINECCLCQICMSKNPQNAKTSIFSQTGKKIPINLNSIPEEFITRLNPNPIQLCPEHKAPFDIIPKAAKDCAVAPENIDFLIIDSGDWFEKEELEEINKNAENTNNPHRVIEYDYQFYFCGATNKRKMQALVFLDKEAFRETHQRDRTETEKFNFLRQLKKLQPFVVEPAVEQPHVKLEPTSQEEELLPKGKIEITTLALKIKYDGKEYTFQNKTALLNSILELVGFGVKISPDDPSLILFVDQKYIEQYQMPMQEKEKASREREKAIRTLIAIDKRITNDISPYLERILKTAENNPENRKIAGEALSKNLFIEN